MPARWKWVLDHAQAMAEPSHGVQASELLLQDFLKSKPMMHRMTLALHPDKSGYLQSRRLRDAGATDAQALAVLQVLNDRLAAARKRRAAK